MSLKRAIKTPCSPISQILDVFLLVTSNMDQSLLRELPSTGYVKLRHCTVVADSQVVVCNRFSYQQAIHSLQHCKHLRGTWLQSRETKASIVLGQVYSKSVYPVRQVHLWLGPRLASHPIVEVYWTQTSELDSTKSCVQPQCGWWVVLTRTQTSCNTSFDMHYLNVLFVSLSCSRNCDLFGLVVPKYA